MDYKVDELSTSGGMQDEPSWNAKDYDESILEQEPVFTFKHTFKQIGDVQVGMFKTDKSYIFINLENKTKIGETDYKKINVVLSGKVMNGLECDYKVAIVDPYRGSGFSYPMYDAIIKHNTGNSGMWGSDSKLTPINLGVWKKLLTKYDHTILISNGRSPSLWIDYNDEKNITRFNLQNIVMKIKSNPDIIWSEPWDKERIRILLKSSVLEERMIRTLRQVFFE